ncbi:MULTISPECIES: GspH/FimT family pseudopilin [unclassified Pseudomonas]|uniref:GspH/FimT family pseudopilin n=1 Tax=unclassified Pseudomonas TaxID=196821 RepID=UPI000A1F473F|nr:MULTISPECIES: GspH/FimT family pseudopilin [unclassified Pseudomonas]
MRQRGVTLIQMMFALAMTALLTQLGMPAYARLSDDLHRAAAARDLAQALRSARSHAMLQSQPVQVQSLEKDWGKGWRVVLESNQQVLREHRLSRPLRIAANAGEQVRFSALGVPVGKGNNFKSATLAICDSQYHVVLASTGRISLRTEDRKNPLCAGR